MQWSLPEFAESLSYFQNNNYPIFLCISYFPAHCMWGRQVFKCRKSYKNHSLATHTLILGWVSNHATGLKGDSSWLFPKRDQGAAPLPKVWTMQFQWLRNCAFLLEAIWNLAAKTSSPPVYLLLPPSQCWLCLVLSRWQWGKLKDCGTVGWMLGPRCSNSSRKVRQSHPEAVVMVLCCLNPWSIFSSLATGKADVHSQGNLPSYFSKAPLVPENSW